MDGLIYMAGVATCAIVLIPCYMILVYQDRQEEVGRWNEKVKVVEAEINRLEQTIRAGLRYEDLPLVDRFEPMEGDFEIRLDNITG